MIIIQVYVSEHWHSPKMFWFVGLVFGMTHLLHIQSTRLLFQVDTGLQMRGRVLQKGHEIHLSGPEMIL